MQGIQEQCGTSRVQLEKSDLRAGPLQLVHLHVPIAPAVCQTRGKQVPSRDLNWLHGKLTQCLFNDSYFRSQCVT